MEFTKKMQETLDRAGQHELQIDCDNNYEMLTYLKTINEYEYIVNIVCYSDNEADIMISRKFERAELYRIAHVLNNLNMKYRCANFFFDEGYVTVRSSCNRLNDNSKIVLDEISNCLNIAVKEFDSLLRV